MRNQTTEQTANETTGTCQARATARQIQVPNQRSYEITFGIEIECFLPRGTIEIGRYHQGIEVGGRFPRGWNAQRDGSLHTVVRNYEGVEIVSPVLKGSDGLQQVKMVAELLNELGAKVNKSCGFHVHIGVTSVAGNDYNDVADFVRRLLKLTAQHEMAFYGAAGTANRYDGQYCHSLAAGKWSQKKNTTLAKKKLTAEELRVEAAGITRFQLLNIAPVFGTTKTVEFRVFSGTTNAVKMCSYIQMALAAACRAMDNDTGFDSIKTKYAGNGASGAMKRFFYMMGWTRGRKDYYKPECKVEGWIDRIENLREAKRELMRLAKQYDGQVGH